MEQPKIPTALPTTTPPQPPSSSLSSSAPPPRPAQEKNNTDSSSSKGRKPPTPEELVAHYEAQGLDSREASLRVIQDLQTILYRTVVSGRGRKDKFMGDTVRKLDNVNTRLAIVEMKLDTKPGYPETLAIGMAAGAALSGIGSAMPHVLGAFGRMWDAIRSSTKGHSSSSSS